VTYSDFFLNSPSSVVELDCIEILHPSFSKTYYIVRNAINGITVTHEDASVHTYDYFPIALTPTGASDDLDQILKVQLGDLGQIIPAELDRIANAGTFTTKPVLKYRTYRSDNLAAPLFGPQKFVVGNISFTKDGSAFEAGAPKLNQTSTGEIYSMDRFPMLRGFQ
jgi:hypothetical protein